MRLAQGASENRKILAVDINQPAVYCAIPRNHSVAVGPVVFQSEVVRLVAHKHPELFEGAII